MLAAVAHTSPWPYLHNLCSLPNKLHQTWSSGSLYYLTFTLVEPNCFLWTCLAWKNLNTKHTHVPPFTETNKNSIEKARKEAKLRY